MFSSAVRPCRYRATRNFANRSGCLLLVTGLGLSALLSTFAHAEMRHHGFKAQQVQTNVVTKAAPNHLKGKKLSW